ncbi:MULTISPECIES: PrkA family serine protein kinase [Peribacillus]|jgi:serine protein kinase|uniref:PrkA family serine protein kinase n=2 Tax=Peribacillus TaxID=2675229 RepID=A0AAJ1VA61_9BACI|nr:MULTISPECIES: PrkA family serine protein kinase [Peribacillus]KRF59942.1 protein prkA [Bacillus sp. Soil745]MBD8138143.1 PrkA family serine protein kinase [Bacillus sp. CFBP 13597]MBL3643204.1 PrkA family serine protein kinase [Bacillus sp. RHFB]MDP9742710.1 serine protein kinase [Bacillus sp. B2I3]MEC0273484.1 PrkA family serine protein kinase [Peribacillus castrilensis]PAW31081.1 protein prkA [Peribacillus simplex]PEF40950.1 protein prkA [Bacillus sp. AFS094228]PEO48210.1 protein prkA 
MDILKKIEKFREDEQKLKWEGTFAEYLEILKETPLVAQSAHSRVYNMIRDAGIEEVNGTKKYNFFSGQLFGLEDSLERLIEEYFHPAAKRLDVRKRILLLMGPVSGGKSTLVSLLKRGLENYSLKDSGAIYAIKGCPMHEDPLHLIPQYLRDDFFEEYGIRIEGNLSPLNVMRLEQEYGSRIEDVMVERIFLSEDKRVGIGTFSPSDPKSQDIADLTGSIDFSTIAEYGSESDPRAYRFDGELNKANRGMMEFQEMLKCDEKFLWHLLSLTQEGNFKAGRFALISADELIVAHTNETEYKAFISNKKNEALHSRIIVMPIPYNLKVTEEEKIYEKMIRESDVSDVHIAPHTLRVAAIFSIMTRLKDPKKGDIDLVKKMRLYDGENVEGFNSADINELKKEYQDEGMSGIDPRYVINRISSTIIRKENPSINALDVLMSLKAGLDQHPSITNELRERYLNFISLARKEYDAIAKNEVQKAFVYSYEESAKILMDNYLDNVEAYCNKSRLRDPLTGEEINPDEKLMRSIEEQIGISENAKKAFREEILIRISAYARKGKRFDYNSHDRLREAIQKKLFADLKDVVKITTSTKTPDERQLKKVNEVITRLIDEHGYNSTSANDLLRYVGSLLNR